VENNNNASTLSALSFKAAIVKPFRRAGGSFRGAAFKPLRPTFLILVPVGHITAAGQTIAYPTRK
jgi:hypothetical protein